MDNQSSSAGAVTATITIQDPAGLHMRVGRDLVNVANQYQATITAENLSRQSPAADVKSIVELMKLQARQGHLLRLSASGPDAQAALIAISDFFAVSDKID
jgi:phosphotransferase system HPr (HPr) family protein